MKETVIDDHRTSAPSHSVSASAYLAIGQVAEQVNAALAAGREPDIDALIAQHPSLADQIRDMIHAENVIPEVFSNKTHFEKDKGVDGIRHPDAKMVRTDRWKLNYYPEGPGELYDLKNDPAEDRNLYGDPGHKTTVAEMKERILYWLTTADETDQIAQKWLL